MYFYFVLVLMQTKPREEGNINGRGEELPGDLGEPILETCSSERKPLGNERCSLLCTAVPDRIYLPLQVFLITQVKRMAPWSIRCSIADSESGLDS